MITIMITALEPHSPFLGMHNAAHFPGSSVIVMLGVVLVIIVAGSSLSHFTFTTWKRI